MFRREADIEGGRTIYGREYISALQNRNKTNLLESLGSAPLIVEELIPEDSESRYLKGQITKSLKKGGDWLGRMSGLNRIPGGLLQIAQQSRNRFMGRIEFELQSLFLPLQGFTRDILAQYESFTIQYRTGSGLGGFIGAVIGYYYLGPIGAQLLGGLGALVGGAFEREITRGGDPRDPISGASYEADWIEDMLGPPPDGGDGLDPSGGLPDLLFTGGPGYYGQGSRTPGEVYGSELRRQRRLGTRVMGTNRTEGTISRRII